MISPARLAIVIEIMGKSLLQDPNPNIRAKAAETLAKLGTEDVLPYLLTAWQADSDPTVRIAAADAVQTLFTMETEKSMAEAPKYDLRGASIGNLADTVQGNQVYNAAPNQAVTEALVEIKKLLATLQQQHPTSSEADLPAILDAELEPTPQNDPGRRQAIMDWLNVAFAGGIETVKLLLPPAGIPIEVGLKLYEIWQKRRSLPEA